MKWVTWENVGIDRMGCGWLLRRFVDPKAEFAFIPEGQSATAKERAFDIPGVTLSHHGGHCSFHAMLREFKLKDPVLHRIARMIDEVDTVQEVTLEPAGTGLDLICRGIRRNSPNDQIALDRGAVVYDALYEELSAEQGA